MEVALCDGFACYQLGFLVVMELFRTVLSRLISEKQCSHAAWYPRDGTRYYYPKPCFDLVRVLSTAKHPHRVGIRGVRTR